MSILGYSSAYFLPQYWANTPLYGEKINLQIAVGDGIVVIGSPIILDGY